MTKACKKRRRVWVSSELGDSSTVFEVEESRLTIKDGVTSIPTCEHQSSYELKAESMNTRKIRLCGNIVRKLIDHKGGWLFKEPVDPVLYGIPDYFDVIHSPMDLGTVKNKLTKKQYVSMLIICLICSLLIYWAGIQKDEVSSQVEHTQRS